MEQLNELKNLVMQNLQKNGYLSNIRAQIRSSVFKTIDSQESSNKKVHYFLSRHPLFIPKILKFKSQLKAKMDNKPLVLFSKSSRSMIWKILYLFLTLNRTLKLQLNENNCLEVRESNKSQISQSYTQWFLHI